MENQETIYCLAFNYLSKGFKAAAVWNHRPTAEEILKVGVFKKNPTRKLEIDLANNIAERKMCRLNFKNIDTDYESWIEYALVEAESNGDLNLNNMAITGVCDVLNDKYNIYEKDYVEL